MARIRFEFEQLRQLAFGNIGANFAQIGGDFENPLRKIVLYSTLDADCILSFDGVTDHWFFPSNNSAVLDIGPEPALAKNSGVWIRHTGAAPTTGAAYVVAMYGVGS